MKGDGPSAVELAKAKGYYAGSIPFELESAARPGPRDRSPPSLHGLGVDYVGSWRCDWPRSTWRALAPPARARLHPDNLAVVMVGRASALEPQLRQAGLPFERVDYRASHRSVRLRGAPRSATAAARAPRRDDLRVSARL